LLVLIIALGVGYVQYRTAGPPKYTNRVDRPDWSTFKFRKDPSKLEVAPKLRAKTCAVTGATGFLASHLIENLLKAGWEITALQRNGSDTSLISKFAKENPQGKLTFATGDITDYASLLRSVPQGIAVMFHVAGAVNLWFGANDHMYKTNVLGTRNVARICLEKDIQKLVHTSSDAVFNGPFRDYNVPFDEHAPHYGLFAWNGYDNTKALAEVEVHAAIEEGGLWATILNPGGIIGPYDINGFARAGRMLIQGQIPMVPSAIYSLGSARAIALAHIAAAERGRLALNYLLCGPLTPYVTLVKLVGDALGIDGARPVAPSFLLSLVAIVNDVVSLFTGTMPDLTMEVAHMVAHNGFCIDARAVNELGYDSKPNVTALIYESMHWLKETNRL